jgi:hypothetical protein
MTSSRSPCCSVHLNGAMLSDPIWKHFWGNFDGGPAPYTPDNIANVKNALQSQQATHLHATVLRIARSQILPERSRILPGFELSNRRFLGPVYFQNGISNTAELWGLIVWSPRRDVRSPPFFTLTLVSGMRSGTLSVFLVRLGETWCTDTPRSHHRGFQDVRNREPGLSSFW